MDKFTGKKLDMESTPETWTKEQREAIVIISNLLEENFGTYVLLSMPPYKDEPDKPKITMVVSILNKGFSSDIAQIMKTYMTKHTSIAAHLGLVRYEMTEDNEFVRSVKF